MTHIFTLANACVIALNNFLRQRVPTEASHPPANSARRKKRFINSKSQFHSNPVIFSFNEKGAYSLNTADYTHCPETHFLCQDNKYCLPVFVRCNGVYDCPGKEDERGCRDAVCPGYYRCRGSAVCLHPDHVCDQFPQCPQQDDELLCNFTCPLHCLCLGLVFKCDSTSEIRSFPERVRALNMRAIDPELSEFQKFSMLIFLDVSNSRLDSISHVFFPNLQFLIVEKNFIKTIAIGDVIHLPNLRHLDLSQNPVRTLFPGDANLSLPVHTLTSLDLSNVYLPALDVSVFNVFPNLRYLNLSESRVDVVLESGNHSLSKLQIVDLRGCAVLDFPPHFFKGLDDLQQMFSDTFKLCCPQVLPAGFNPINCQTPDNLISSCNNLLRSNTYRLFLVVFAVLALGGNVISLFSRLRCSKANRASGYRVFVTHLSLSDGLMGVYLVIIGVADRFYQDTYLWQDVTWKNSAVCTAAGYLALLSTEMSAISICLITLDRFLVLCFPFSRLRFGRISAHVACCVHWAITIIVVSVPLFPAYRHWGFYSHTDICIPLPITRSSFAGHSFAFGVMIVLNMTLFIIIVAGQSAVYLAVKTNKMSSTDSTSKTLDLQITRRLVTIALTDFLCWFPIGLAGLLASTGTAVPGEVNVAMATLVIPLNSAMNPFLYTMNVLLEKRRKAREDRIMKYFKSQSEKVSSVPV